MQLSPDVTYLLEDTDLGAQAFTIRRTKGTWNKGRQEKQTPEEIPAVGIIQPTASEELEHFPEGTRKKGMITIYSRTMIYAAEGDTFSDEITWNDHVYKVEKSDRWQDYGYCAAYAARR